MILLINIILKTTLLENSVRMPEMYGVYSHIAYQ